VPIRILYLLDCTGDVGGGAERLAVSVLTHLDPLAYDRYLCLSRPSAGLLVEQAQAAGVTILQLHRRSRYDILPWLRLIRFVRRERIDVLHSHKHGSNFWGAIVSILTCVPVFLAHEHSWTFSGNRLRILIDRFLIARQATRVIAVSAADRDLMISIERIPAAKIVLIPNGIPEAAENDDQTARVELQIPTHAVLLACVGVRTVKRVDLVLEALALLSDEQPSLYLLVIGDFATEVDKLRQIADSLGLASRVRFVGERRDVSRLLASADIAVLASDREGSPLAVLEYMAAGCAIVATRVGGIPAILRDGVEGVLVDPGQANQLAETIGELAQDATRRAELGRAARARQADDFSLRAVVRRTSELYGETLGLPAGDPRTAFRVPTDEAASSR
jgi:glycosyltransferase involved in cell wall biosynthesis